VLGVTTWLTLQPAIGLEHVLAGQQHHHTPAAAPRLLAMLANLHCSKPLPAGDAVALNTPMTAEAVVALLGILLAGCVVVAIADSFAAAEISSRLRIAKAKAVITQVRNHSPCSRG